VSILVIGGSSCSVTLKTAKRETVFISKIKCLAG